MTKYQDDLKVAVVYPHLPHYRYGVFKELENRIEDIRFIFGGSSKDGSIASIPPGTFKKETRVQNVWFGPVLWQRGLARALHEYRPDAVVFLGDAAHLSTWVMAILSRLRGQRVYFWTIGWHRPDKGLRKLIRKTFYKLSDKLLLYGNHGREIGILSGFPKDRMAVIFNSWGSLANAESVELATRSLPSGSRPVIGAVIRLSPGKGLPEIVKAIAHLRDEFGIEVDGLIVGEGPERELLEELATELGVSLYLPGAIYDEATLKQIYQKLEVTVVPKAAGLTVIQSLSEGTPVITLSDPYKQMPEFEAIEDNITGSLIDDVSPESIAKACEFWISRLPSEKKAAEEVCRTTIESHWTPISQANRIINVLTLDAD